MKQKPFLSILICLLALSACAQPKGLEQIPHDQAIDIVVATDLHYLDDALFDDGAAFTKLTQSGDGRILKYNNEVVEAFVDQMIERHPDIVLLSGDLTNNGEKSSHQGLADKLQRLVDAGIRVYVVPGNHDILNAWARSFNGDQQEKVDSVTPRQFKSIYANFGFDEAVKRDPSSLSYLAMPSKDLWLLMLDTNKYSKTGELQVPITSGTLSDKTLEWIQSCVDLAKKDGAKILTVMHHNLIDHNQLFRGYTIDRKDKIQDFFQDNQLSITLSGHMHIQDIKRTGDETRSITDILTSSLLMSPFQYGWIHVEPNVEFEYSSQQVDVEGWAKDHQLTDPNLLDFKAYAADYFYQKSYQKAYESLLDEGGYTEEEMDEMAQVMGWLNPSYNAGMVQSIRDEVMQSTGYKLWLRASEPEFLAGYIARMLYPEPIDPRHVVIDWTK